VRVGLLGLPGSGKTTLFSLLTGHTQRADSRPFARSGPGIGTLKVSDTRLDRVAELFESERVVRAEITLLDVPCDPNPRRGSDAVDSLAKHLGDADAFAVVIGAFRAGPEDAAGELDDVLLSLMLSDADKIERRLERVSKELQRGNKEAEKEQALLLRLQEHLEQGGRLATIEMRDHERQAVRGFQFLTQKPVLVVANVGEEDVAGEELSPLRLRAEEHGFPLTVVAGLVELEIAELDEEEQTLFLAEYDIAAPARLRCIRAAYDVLDAVTLYTTAHGESRAWPVTAGTSAWEAAGRVHTDMQTGFIRAEIVSYDALIQAGSVGECRSRGQVRLEGREYAVQDGDIATFRFSN